MLLKEGNSFYLCCFAGAINIINTESTIKSLMVLAKKSDLFTQLVNFKCLVGLNQLLFAFDQALNSFNSGNGFTRTLELEFLIWLTGEKQIERALDLVEFSRGENLVLLVFAKEKKGLDNPKKFFEHAFKSFVEEFGFKESGKPLDELFKENVEKNLAFLKKAYCISNNQLLCLQDKDNPLEEAVLEKISLVALEN